MAMLSPALALLYAVTTSAVEGTQMPAINVEDAAQMLHSEAEVEPVECVE